MIGLLAFLLSNAADLSATEDAASGELHEVFIGACIEGNAALPASSAEVTLDHVPARVAERYEEALGLRAYRIGGRGNNWLVITDGQDEDADILGTCALFSDELSRDELFQLIVQEFWGTDAPVVPSGKPLIEAYEFGYLINFGRAGSTRFAEVERLSEAAITRGLKKLEDQRRRSITVGNWKESH